MDSKDTDPAADAPRITNADRVRAIAMAQVEGELAALAASRAAPVVRPRRRQSGSSIVFALRLDVADVAALERRAALLAVPPSILARNLLRAGLSDHARPTLAGVVNQLDTALAGLRALASEGGAGTH
jgi:hypothetical protein